MFKLFWLAASNDVEGSLSEMVRREGNYIIALA